jgi:histone H3/H4
MADDASYWKRCSSCKKEIGYSTTYWVCSVSTCTRKRTGMVFCSVSCWEVHLPMMRHRESYAVEKRSPTQAQWLREQQEEAAQAHATASPAPSTSAPAVRRRGAETSHAGSDTAFDAAEDNISDDDLPRDILVISSKLKQYIRARSGMNTSDGVLSVLSDHLRAICRQAIRNAAQDGRKTVLDRDIPRPPRA